MRVEVWSDVVCPWCYLGQRRLAKALTQFEHAGTVEIEWRSYQLDPSFPKDAREPVYEMLAKKTGGTADQVKAMTEHVRALAAEEGLAFDFDRAVSVNTFDAHRLTHLAKAHGLGAEAHERLLRAHLVEGEEVNDPDTLVRLGVEVGVPEDEARRVLSGDEYTRDVLDDIRQAQQLGATGVPFFVLDRAFGVAGAQPVEAFLSALRQAHDHAAASTR